MAAKRLYIGGLSHTISQKDLKDRFGKFGDVQDVELLTRKDEDGVPYKTFGYININISDADYRRCMTVLNKSKWKGGTLQIEMAKESFLQRLAQERQQAAEKIEAPTKVQQETLVESFKNAGVENFYMKAAVPGTEVPGHKDWVVSKFGRVLPVLNLKCHGKKKIIKYDPSKHCHNIKKLEDSAGTQSLTPVSKLTWEILEANDEISKKRRGEFPPQTARPTKIQNNFSSKLTVKSQSDVDMNGELETFNGRLDKVKKGSGENGIPVLKQKPAPSKPQFPSVSVFDQETDSDEEIRLLVAQKRSQNTLEDEEDDDNLEVVGDDYMAIPKQFCPLQKTNYISEPSVGPSEEAYDSADTDEILTSSKTPKVAEREKSESLLLNSLRHLNTTEKHNATVKTSSKKVLSTAKQHLSQSARSDGDNEGYDGSETSGESDYEAMFTNCHRLEISLADLEQLAKESSNSPDEHNDQGSDSQAGPSQVSDVLPSKLPLPKKGTTPEEILAAILEDDSSDERTKKKKKKKKKSNSSTPLPAFQGTMGLMWTLQNAEENGSCKRQLDDNCKTDVSSKKQKLETVLNSNHSSFDAIAKTVQSSVPNAESTSSCDSSSSEATKSSGEEDDFEEDGISPKGSDTELAKQAQETINLLKRPQVVSDPEKQLQDNQRRLAAMEQRQKEAEQQKKLIQEALAEVDTLTANKSKHIVFCSDDESDRGEEQSTSKGPTPKKSLFQNSQSDEEDSSEKELQAFEKESFSEKMSEKQAVSKLFDSSEGEDEDEDNETFKIKPQFEGKSGQKLMQLQSRFGADERFHMDSKFLESDDESETPENKSSQNACELEEEKKKNLDILQNLINDKIVASNSSKVPAKGMMFRDISTLHYDPTREDHASFETKTEQKESKGARRKKRVEAEKLPEVSQEMYYDVTADLKSVFGTTYQSVVEEKKMAWDKEEVREEKEKAKESQTADIDAAQESPVPSPSPEIKESTGFKFSFFGDNTEADNTSEKEEYKVETLKGAKVSWQVDPRFQDSSSEDEEVAAADEDQTSAVKTTEEAVSTKRAFFFFREDDERLKEGPKTFCRSAKLEDQRQQWEEKRTSLIEEYRKKHKDAKRKLKASQRN